jgi:hypothetical protein
VIECVSYGSRITPKTTIGASQSGVGSSLATVFKNPKRRGGSQGISGRAPACTTEDSSLLWQGVIKVVNAPRFPSRRETTNQLPRRFFGRTWQCCTALFQVICKRERAKAKGAHHQMLGVKDSKLTVANLTVIQGGCNHTSALFAPSVALTPFELGTRLWPPFPS